MTNLSKKAISNAVHNHLQGYYPSRKHWLKVFAMLPVLACTPTTYVIAQENGLTLDEIVVTARRRDENLQDVPVTVNVVDSEMLKDMNIRRFEDLTEVVAGLELEDRATGPTAAMRGVRFDAFASGPSVEFYLNDSLIVSNEAMQSMFDVGTVEVLRGPQGTLRGKASPSGSIIMTTKRPDLEKLTGDIDVTTTDEGGRNARGGLSIPIVEEMLAVRIAGFTEENRINHAKSINGDRAKMESDGWRVSVQFNPLETLSINAYHQDISTDRWQLSTVESANVLDPGLPPSPIQIRDTDRLSVQPQPTTNFGQFERTGLEVAWDIGPIRLNYAGSINDAGFDNLVLGDTVGFFDESYPEVLRGFVSQEVNNTVDSKTHELRVSGNITEDLTYVLGGFYTTFSAKTDVLAATPLFFFGTGPANFGFVNLTPVVAMGHSTEKSYFGNLTYQLGEDTELSAGLRFIDYKSDQSTAIIGGSSLGSLDQEESPTIYSVSLAHNFTEDLMAYVAAGSSWRPGVIQIGNSDLERTQREQDFLQIGPEESDSIEVGIKSTSLDNRLRLNATVFYQQFDDYPDRGIGGSVRFVNTGTGGLVTVGSDTFMAGVELETYGLELDGSFQITDNWYISGTYSWAQGTQEGQVACNDYFPADGIPDTNNPPVTVDEIRAATGGDDVGSCAISARSYEAPTWSTSLRTEYSHTLFDNYTGYARLQANIYGASKGNVTNPNDDLSSYGVFSLFAGVRSPEYDWGSWEIMAFVKNLLDREEREDFGTNPITTDLTVIGPTGVNAVQIESPYRSVVVSQPREFGLNVRYNF